MKRFTISALLILSACATPQEQCINAATRDMQVVDQLIAETEGNIQRGFALERETIYRTEFQDCTPRATEKNPEPKQRMCPVEVPETTTRPKAVDLNAEKAKLKSLTTKRAAQGKAAHAAMAQCRVQYPE